MRRFTFLSSEFIYLILALVIYSFFYLPFLMHLVVAILSLILLFIFRRRNIPYRDTIKNSGEIYLSPVHGLVRSIRYSVINSEFFFPCHEIRISVSQWDEKGIYLPSSIELTQIKEVQGRAISTDSPPHAFYGALEDVAHTDLTMISKNGTQTFMRFVDCFKFSKSRIWLKSGDRGRGGACFGYYPMGGTLLIYLPADSDILIFENEKVTPAQTVIAALKDQPKV